MNADTLPDFVRQLADNEKFTFRCHPGIDCFNECCRQLELALSPYDVLRLKQALGITSDEFLEKYGIVEETGESAYPAVYLTMVDDGRASCPFVTSRGCSIYEGRPGACRTYPVGRGVSLHDGGKQELYVLLTEPHCHGFIDEREQDIAQWNSDQGLESYNLFNDLLLPFLQHEKIRNGYRPDEAEKDLFLLALYNLDVLRSRISMDEIISITGSHQAGAEKILNSDEELLQFAIRWLHKKLYNE